MIFKFFADDTRDSNVTAQGRSKKLANVHFVVENFFSDFDVCMELGMHQNSTWIALTFKNLSHHSTKACIPAVKKSVSNACSQ